MAQYIVTITPVVMGDDGDEEESASTTMRVVAGDGQAYIRELTVRVGENPKPGPGEVLQVDLDILLQAFARRHLDARPHGRAPVDTIQAPVPAMASASTSTSAAKPERAYRRMPDPAEVKATFLTSRTITGVAQHYGVPTHTAQGWITRLRRKGVLPAD